MYHGINMCNNTMVCMTSRPLARLEKVLCNMEDSIVLLMPPLTFTTGYCETIPINQPPFRVRLYCCTSVKCKLVNRRFSHGLNIRILRIVFSLLGYSLTHAREDRKRPDKAVLTQKAFVAVTNFFQILKTAYLKTILERLKAIKRSS